MDEPTTFDEFWAMRPDGMDIIVYDTASAAWDAATVTAGSEVSQLRALAGELAGVPELFVSRAGRQSPYLDRDIIVEIPVRLGDLPRAAEALARADAILTPKEQPK